MAEIMRQPRAGALPSQLRCWLVTASLIGTRPASRFSTISRGAPTRIAGTQRWGSCPRLPPSGGDSLNRSFPNVFLCTKPGNTTRSHRPLRWSCDRAGRAILAITRAMLFRTPSPGMLLLEPVNEPVQLVDAQVIE